MEDKNGQEEQAHASRSKDRRRNGQSGPQGSAGCKSRRASQERTARHLQTSRRPQAPAAPDHQASQESPELSLGSRLSPGNSLPAPHAEYNGDEECLQEPVTRMDGGDLPWGFLT